MFEFFGGVTLRIVLDNLKSAVIKPDLYDPSINRSYREMAEHYHCFIDPCRVASPKDKGKVERDVQTVRQAVRKLRVLNPDADIVQLNRMLRDWSISQYGQKKHGTTQQAPFELFTNKEQGALKALPKIVSRQPSGNKQESIRIITSSSREKPIQCPIRMSVNLSGYAALNAWYRSIMPRI